MNKEAKVVRSGTLGQASGRTDYGWNPTGGVSTKTVTVKASADKGVELKIRAINERLRGRSSGSFDTSS